MIEFLKAIKKNKYYRWMMPSIEELANYYQCKEWCWQSLRALVAS